MITTNMGTPYERYADARGVATYGWGIKAQALKIILQEKYDHRRILGIVYLRKNLVNEGYSTGDKMKIIIVKNGKDK